MQLLLMIVIASTVCVILPHYKLMCVCSKRPEFELNIVCDYIYVAVYYIMIHIYN